MEKFLKGFGILALAVVCLAAVGIGALIRNGSVLDGESRAFVEAAIPAITATWDQQALLDRASPTLKTLATPERLTDTFGKFTPLGAIVSFEAPRGHALMMYGTAASFETASYVTNAKFQNGDAMVKIALVKADGRWMINGFYVEPLTRLAASRA